MALLVTLPLIAFGAACVWVTMLATYSDRLTRWSTAGYYAVVCARVAGAVACGAVLEAVVNVLPMEAFGFFIIVGIGTIIIAIVTLGLPR